MRDLLCQRTKEEIWIRWILSREEDWKEGEKSAGEKDAGER